MTDKEFGKIISKCKLLAIQHRDMIRIAEQEYERRFGANPSDIDDDWWIDTVHYGNGSSNVEPIILAAKKCIERNNR